MMVIQRWSLIDETRTPINLGDAEDLSFSVFFFLVFFFWSLANLAKKWSLSTRYGVKSGSHCTFIG